MIGLEVEGKPLLRAYSFVSPNYEEELEFLSIKVADGPLTSRLQHIHVGDTVLIGTKPVGTLVQDSLLPGRRLYLLATGTGLAPFMSIIRDPDTYERYDKVILVHGCRLVSELAYGDYITHDLPNHELLGDLIREKLSYYTTVTREPHRVQGRITTLLNPDNCFLTSDVPLRRSPTIALCSAEAPICSMISPLCCANVGLKKGHRTIRSNTLLKRPSSRNRPCRDGMPPGTVDTHCFNFAPSL